MGRIRDGSARPVARPMAGVGWVVGSVILFGCGDDATGPERTGTVLVSVRTVGVDLDLDGYSVRIDQGDPQAVDINGTLTLVGVPTGPHRLTLDGLAITCDPDGGGTREIEVRTGLATPVHMSVTCTGKPVVFESRRDGTTLLYRMNLDGSGVRSFDRVGYAPRWSPDGTRILFHHDSLLFVMNADGSGLRALTRGAWGSWSPDGKSIVFERVVGADLWDESYWTSIHVIAATGGVTTRLTEDAREAHSPDWGPDGRIAFMDVPQDGVSTGFWLSVMDADGTNVAHLREGRWESLAWSPDGTRFAVNGWSGFGEQSSIFVVPTDGGDVTKRTALTASEAEPRWLPDGSNLIFTSYSAADGRSEVRIGSWDAAVSTPVSHFLTAYDGSADVRRTEDIIFMPHGEPPASGIR